MYVYIYIHTNLPVNAIVRPPHPWSGDSQGQETFCYIYICVCVCVCVFNRSYVKMALSFTIESNIAVTIQKIYVLFETVFRNDIFKTKKRIQTVC